MVLIELAHPGDVHDKLTGQGPNQPRSKPTRGQRDNRESRQHHGGIDDDSARTRQAEYLAEVPSAPKHENQQSNDQDGDDQLQGRPEDPEQKYASKT